MIYLDNAATTLHKPKMVIDAVVKALESLGNCARGTYESSLQAGRTIYDAREKAASLFGCKQADHVVFTANSTEALNMAIQGLVVSGDHVISSDLEHNSVLRPLYLMEKRGVELSFVKADKDGKIEIVDFEKLIKENTKMIVCTHASNVTGNVVDIANVGAIARKHGLFFVVDASQTAGVIPIDMESMGIDVLCFTGHKSMMAPQGTGGLCVREGIVIRPLVVGGSGIRTYEKEHPANYPTALEAGTLNGHGIAGLDAGITFINQTGMANIYEKEIRLARRFYEGVKGIPEVVIYGDFSNWNRAPIISLNIGEYDSSEVSDELSERFEIATRPGAHCAPRMHEALKTVEQGVVRFSFSYFNTDEEVDVAIQAVRTLAEE
ncbi:MAG: aminotransferase class V-fold PLP-dependent enzyme [Lachnospiraceae bacterium]|nr:aminotransferase class V-fold PLP-dependent enzyme [Lachnospiraceae bacterium]MDD3617566.1 aminotransferase class V-fold PLP-dependent enzyme [Lachnospiraceae bacterium]